MIRKVLEELTDPALGGATCTPALLLERTKASLDVIDTTTANFSLYNNDPTCEFVPHSLTVWPESSRVDVHSETSLSVWRESS